MVTNRTDGPRVYIKDCVDPDPSNSLSLAIIISGTDVGRHSVLIYSCGTMIDGAVARAYKDSVYVTLGGFHDIGSTVTMRLEITHLEESIRTASIDTYQYYIDNIGINSGSVFSVIFTIMVMIISVALRNAKVKHLWATFEDQ